MARKTKAERFNDYVVSKFEIYNSLFLKLPFDSIPQTSLLLPLFTDFCVKGYESDLAPKQIVDEFFESFAKGMEGQNKHDLLFSFLKFIERQIVLFDAIEDAGFSYVNNMHGRGTLRYTKEGTKAKNNFSELKEYLNRFKVRIVLTAHPTQFYPGSVLGIITDLSDALKNDNLEQIKLLLAQLGKTRFFNKKKPSPLDEAVSLMWFLENVFYKSAAVIYNYLEQHIFEGETIDNSIFDFGFWPGGDRDGNPFVTPEITLKTAEKLRFSILRNYYRDLRKLKRKITFDEVDLMITDLESTLYHTLFNPNTIEPIDTDFMIKKLEEIEALLKARHQSLYLNEIVDLRNKVKLFGFHFASLDIRQDSRIHNQVFETIVSHPNIQDYITGLPENYLELSLDERLLILPQLTGNVPESLFDDDIVKHTLGSIYAMKSIQERNGEKGCHRYIISNCQSIENMLQLFALHRICGWDSPTVDLIPLFETVDDLQVSQEIMHNLYSNPFYSAHLKTRNMKQTIMLGFSDGTKDGGYFMANWSIYKAKEELSDVSGDFGVAVAFFDGRGGPPARGGGNTHKFYASMGDRIKADDIQLTVQGQTISSNFGTLDSSQFNLEQLLSSGISNQVFKNDDNQFADKDRITMQQLADISYQSYSDFKSHPKFVSYLENMSTLQYYSKTNIGSRPSKRGSSSKLNFSDLRAIPFVGSWSQSKQNVPGFFGVGTAIKSFEVNGDFDKVSSLYENSAFFRTLIANSMMSLTKSFFKLTAHIGEDKEYGPFWNIIHDEYMLTKEMLLKLTGYTELMEDQPAGKHSIEMREAIVQPLLTIQQYALSTIQELKNDNLLDDSQLEVYEKLVTRSLFGNINASRNSC